MVFSSVEFLFLFLPITIIGYYLMRKELKNAFLLIMSIVFYAVGEPSFVWIMLASILVNYLLGLVIHKTLDSPKAIRRVILVLTVCANLGILFYYKYYDFFFSNINSLFGTQIPLRNLVLPIGISFFTFQGMSYVLDVYMKKTTVQKNPLNVALYVALFPQLVAGPIVRYTDISEQITNRTETLDDFAAGMQRFAVGLAKKVVFSNTFAVLADMAFNTVPAELSAPMAWLGAVGYSMQIYFDFSGYSDMAIGLGKIFGFHFNENFNYPYSATSITDFWRRWHISLTNWFRDYIYIPLGGNRKGNVYLHVFIVFLLTGIWHGASWNFIVWGLWHGLFRLIELFIQRINKKAGKADKKSFLPAPVKWLFTMLIVMIGWVFFRAPDLSSAVSYLGCMIGLGGTDNGSFIYVLQDYAVTLILGIVCAAPMWPKIKDICNTYEIPNKAYKFLQPVVFVCILVMGISYTITSTYNPFIYFNF